MICIGLASLAGCGNNGYKNKPSYSEVKTENGVRLEVASSEMVVPYSFEEIKEDVEGTLFSGIDDIFDSSKAKKYDSMIVDINSEDETYVGIVVFEKEEDRYYYAIVIPKDIIDVDVKEGYIE